MVIQPKVRGFLCTTAHPTGCFENVRRQAEHVQSKGEIADGPKRVLVLGASTGYGLASRITAAFGSSAATIGVFFEKPGTDRKSGTAGWYNSAGFHQLADEANLYAKSLNGDAFSDEMKTRVIDLVKADLGQLDLVVYSLAAPRRTHPKTGEVFNSTLKPIGQATTQKGVNTDKEAIQDFRLEPATQEEIDHTVAVMGGEDWEYWIDALAEADLLAEGAKTISYTYIGSKLTWPIYWDGTLGLAKADLDRASKAISEKLTTIGGKAQVAVLKAIVSQASAAIPVVPLYVALLFRVMKRMNLHEDCITHIYRLFATQLLDGVEQRLDDEGRIRMDDLELRPEIQKVVSENWLKVTTENLDELGDLEGFRSDFLNIFGFGFDEIDYELDVDPKRILDFG